MKVFIINLKRSVTRRKSIEKECVKYQLDYEFIEAVDGLLLSPAEIKRHTREVNYACKPGEIGCSLSHLKVYRLMCARSINKALILEDDAKLTPEITDVLAELDKIGNCKKPTITLLTKPGQYRDKCLCHIDKNHGVYPVIEASLSHGYVINYPAAKKALKALYPVWMVADRWQLFKEYSISDINAVIPAVVVHSELACTSTINAPDEDKSYILAKKQIWDKLKKSRPLSIKLKRAFWLLCKKNFIKIVKC